MFSAEIGIYSCMWVGNVVNIFGQELPRSAVPLFVQCCQMLPRTTFCPMLPNVALVPLFVQCCQMLPCPSFCPMLPNVAPVPLFVHCCQMLPSAPLFVLLFIHSLILPNVLYALGQGQVIFLLLIVLSPFDV